MYRELRSRGGRFSWWGVVGKGGRILHWGATRDARGVNPASRLGGSGTWGQDYYTGRGVTWPSHRSPWRQTVGLGLLWR